MPQLKRHRFWSNERGFTLPEVMITIVIMGIAFGIATSSWFGTVEARVVDSATNQMVSDLRLAHTRAANQLTDWRIVYGINGTQVANCPTTGQSADYCLVKNTGTGAELIARYLPENSRISATTVSVDTVAGLLGPSIAGTTRTVKFNADGSAQAMGGLAGGAASPALTVSSTDGNPSHVISINSATSRVKID